MAHFYGTLQGSARTVATRCGTKTSGLESSARGWGAGVNVVATHGYRTYTGTDGEDRFTRSDRFEIALTHGSNRRGATYDLGSLVETPTGIEFRPSRQLLEALRAEGVVKLERAPHGESHDVS